MVVNARAYINQSITQLDVANQINMTDPRLELSKKQEINWFSVVIFLQTILPTLVSLYIVIYEAKVVTTIFGKLPNMS